MIVNNLRFTVRHLLRQKVNSALHITGLTLGMSVCLLIGLFIHYETSFDLHHEKSKDIYRVNSVFKDGGMKIDLYATPIQLAEAIRNEVTGIEKATFARAQFKTVVEINPQKLFKQERVLIVEPEFLDIFGIEVLQGDAHKALRTPYQALLTETTAKKLFGNEDALGKTFKYKNKFTITVAGVIRDMPSTTNLPATMLLSYAKDRELLDNGDTWHFGDFEWVKLSVSTYILLKENSDIRNIEVQLKKLVDKNINTSPVLSKEIHGDFELQSLRDIHFDTQRFGGGPWVKVINRSWLLFFAGIALIVLILACINFLNLSTAQAFARGKEVGVRKSIGAQRGQLIIQFLVEAALLVFASAGLSIIVAFFSLAPINQLLDKGIIFQPLQSPQLISFILIGILLTILLAGLYPAWVIAKFNPIVTLKSNSQGGAQGSTWLRKVLVTIQFTVSAALLIAVLLIAQQVDYMLEKELGFEKENIVNVEITDPNKAPGLFRELQQIPSVKDVSLSRTSPISDDHWWNSIGQTENSDRHGACVMYVDDRFYSFYNLHLLSGRLPQSSEYIPDSLRSDQYINKVVVNQNLLKTLALGEPAEAIGKHFWWGIETEIIGVIADFNAEPLSQRIPATILTHDPTIYAQANIKIEKGSNLATTLASIEKVWKKNSPEGVYEAKFLNSQIDGFYKLEKKLYALFKVFAAIAVLISCLGLWGLVSFTAQQRTKEIGIRKVLGASVNAILVLLSKDFILVVLIAFALASPLAYYLMNELLANFAFHISIGWQVFVVTGTTLLTLTILTVSFQIIKAAMANPVNSLKSE